MAVPFGKTADLFEMQFGTNHLGHFLPVNRIASLMKPGARLVNLSSLGHRLADVDLDDPNFAQTPDEEWLAYGRSKTANVLFAVEFDNRHKARSVRATAVHPGTIQTELGRYMTPEVTQRVTDAINAARRASGGPPFEWKIVPQGTATSVWASTVAKDEDMGGRYCEDCHVAEIVEDPSVWPGGVRRYAVDPERAKALWAKSEEMVGQRF
jgi:NAD(P)-dependent dehydrogenase (short-subunit alcohol dehydrogenase family)